MIVIANVDDPSDFIVGDSVPMDWEEKVEAKVATIHAINRNLPYHHFMSSSRKVSFTFLVMDYDNSTNSNKVNKVVNWLNNKCLSTQIGIKHPKLRISWFSNDTSTNFDSGREYYLLSVNVKDSVINVTGDEVNRQTAMVSIELSQTSDDNISEF